MRIAVLEIPQQGDERNDFSVLSGFGRKLTLPDWAAEFGLVWLLLLCLPQIFGFLPAYRRSCLKFGQLELSRGWRSLERRYSEFRRTAWRSCPMMPTQFLELCPRFILVFRFGACGNIQRRLALASRLPTRSPDCIQATKERCSPGLVNSVAAAGGVCSQALRPPVSVSGFVLL